MYATEKSLLNAAHTSAKAAAVVATKLPIPARRAVSANRSGETRLRLPVASCLRATAPATSVYPLRARAKRRAKLPKVGMADPSIVADRVRWRQLAARRAGVAHPQTRGAPKWNQAVRLIRASSRKSTRESNWSGGMGFVRNKTFKSAYSVSASGMPLTTNTGIVGMRRRRS
jgi:hypothetical protein